MASIWEPRVERRAEQLARNTLYRISQWSAGLLIVTGGVLVLFCGDTHLECFPGIPFLIALTFSVGTLVAALKYKRGTMTTMVPMVVLSFTGSIASSAFGVFHLFVLPYVVFAHLEARFERVRDLHPLIKRALLITILLFVIMAIELFGKSLDRLLLYS